MEVRGQNLSPEMGRHQGGKTETRPKFEHPLPTHHLRVGRQIQGQALGRGPEDTKVRAQVFGKRIPLLLGSQRRAEKIDRLIQVADRFDDEDLLADLPGPRERWIFHRQKFHRTHASTDLLDRRRTFVSNAGMSWPSLTFFTTDHVDVPLPPGHRFPMEKYRLLREKLLRDSVVKLEQLVPATPASDVDLLRAHDRRYVEGLRNHTLPEKELRPIGLTWSPQLLERSLTSVGGFIAATDHALKDGFSALLAGGTHHAHADRGEGYCVFNDFAVAALRLLDLGRVKRILIIDLDVHQGNGNSSILGHREDVFILSLHGERNYPFRKVPSHLDVALPEGTTDEAYLEALEGALRSITFEPEIIFYQAGVDNLREDLLGTFHLTFEGLRARDRRVLKYARGTPVALAIGGGYASPIDLTVEAYANTFKVAREIFSQ